MKYLSYILLLFPIAVFSQTMDGNEKGEVSFMSAQNIYVSFVSTEDIAVGDTLFSLQENKLTPALLVTNKSSISCVCKPLEGISGVKKGDAFFVKKKKVGKKMDDPFSPLENSETEEEVKPEQFSTLAENPTIQEEIENPFKENIKGRISAASYSNLGDRGELHRMRYGFSFRGNNINDSRFSFENDIVFRHTQGEWSEVQNNFMDALKIYSLAASYDFSEDTQLTLGRKINPRMSSLGAIDGLQFEKGVGQFVFGAIAGSRPDWSDYSVNPNLMQAGAFVSHVSKKRYGLSTLGFAEQRNKGAVDRRFVYFQHSSSPVNNLNLFTSFEVDMYEKINGEVGTQPRLTNIYASLRYRFSRKFSLSASYDARKNILFYESYKSFIENLVDQETRQGLRLGVNVRPMKYLTIGVNANMRFQNGGLNKSENLSAYVNISRLPKVGARLSLRANFLKTNYLDSRIYSARLSKDIIKGKLSADIYYRFIEYQYQGNEFMIRQHVGGASLNVRLANKLSLYLYGENTFDDADRSLLRLNAKVVKRF